MKVLIITFLLNPMIGGGAATSALRLCEGLAQQGVDVVALTTHNEPEPRITVEGNLKTYSFLPRNLYWVGEKDKQPRWKKAIWQLFDTWNPSTHRYLREVIRQEQPDVIHIHKLRGLSPSVWAAAAAENCRPIVQTCRDYELISPEGMLNSKIGHMAQKRHWLIQPYQALRARWSNEVDIATAPSRFTLQTIADMGFFNHALQVVVPNTHGLSAANLDSIEAESRHTSSVHSAELHLLYLGRLETEKGVEVMCRAFADLTNDLPHVYLDILGTGTKEQALKTEYSHITRMRFYGHVSGAEKGNIVSSSDILVMPTIVEEVFGNSIIEAYAHGKPVIASRIGGMPEIVREGETGLLVEPGSGVELQRAIRKLVAEPVKLMEMSQACYEAARLYSLETVTGAYLAAYETGLSRMNRTKKPAGGLTQPHSYQRVQ